MHQPIRREAAGRGSLIDAFTSAAPILGSERTGNGVVINSDGLILTIGYLVTEATDVWLTTPDGRELGGPSSGL